MATLLRFAEFGELAADFVGSLSLSPGRDHLAYRGAYAPVKGVIDGDLCNEFRLLSMQKQAQIAQELDRTTSEVLKKIEAALAHSW